ncbi:09c8108f-5d34-442b-8e21-7520750b0fdf [Thermothielavioides terrestris]|uniref:09c8108f-5d34-442b-8e21-7520750b0fdf n=1 Tax=Thermothielavioides terrestris TaxID=2587410 RepID=A0A446BRW1_9PEZI|nr:09c8108f-5d34-442b-8e21-7520750b0fdf [Thermothielavioides terrestris]
MPPYTRKTI